MSLLSEADYAPQNEESRRKDRTLKCGGESMDAQAGR